LTIQIYQVDAFSDKPFSGNPAAVCPLEHWLPDTLMQQIAAENNLSETAFFVPQGDHYRIRWFTPTTEVDLCGHATLASAFVLFHCLKLQGDTVQFDSNSGPLFVERQGPYFQMDFPHEPCVPCAIPELLPHALGAKPRYTLSGEDLLAVFDTEAQVAALQPHFESLLELPYRGVIATAKGDEVDFVCRFFAPAVGVNEDPATGSAFTKLVPYWTKRLNKKSFHAKQISARGGHILCEHNGERVLIRGQACLVMHGELLL
jgi:predicted PhzF superfamily epimerase YddE/YHI9